MIRENSILFVINTMKSGGAAKNMLFVVQIANKVFDNIYVVTIEDEKPSDLFEKNIIQYQIKVSKKLQKLKCVWRVPVIFKLRKIIKVLKPSAVCAFISDVSVTTKIAMVKINIPLILSERGDPNDRGEIWKILTRYAYGNATACVFQTKAAMNCFKSKKIESRSVIISNPFIPKRLLGDEIFKGERDKTIVTAGAFLPNKCHILLIKAFEKIHKKYPEYKLKIYGQGPLKNDYLSLVKQMNLEGDVFFPGYIYNLTDAISKAGIFVFLSRSEGIPNAVLEALSLGVPTVCTDCSPGGGRMLLEDGRNGVLIPTDDLNAVVEAVFYIIENPDEAKKYSINGLSIKEKFKPEKIANKWINVFNKILLK